MRKTPRDPSISSTSCLLFNPRREYYLIFGYSDIKGWYDRFLDGYTHVTLAQHIVPTYLSVIEPMDHAAITGIIRISELAQMKGKILHLKTNVTRKSKLIKPTIQTCATLIQYMMGINLGVITCQSMYDRLVNKDSKWLRKRGVLEVKEWAERQKVGEEENLTSSHKV